jgi:tocopherol O-methyltransferase
MIHPYSKQAPGDVAAHYDTLDQFYREIWGEHVHHGYWRTGHETPEDAAAALVELVADRLDLMPRSLRYWLRIRRNGAGARRDA